MSDKKINHDIVKKIVRFSYKKFKSRQSNGMTKSQVIDEIVKKLKEEIKNNADSEN